MTVDLDPKMNQIARAALIQLLERHILAMEQVLVMVGSHLHENDRAALDDHCAAMARLNKTLGASGL